MILNFIILYLVISLISGFIMRYEKNILGCGLAGFYPKKNKKVNLQRLFLLGVFNEQRGEDSCGFSVGDNRYVGVKNTALARNFILDQYIDIVENDFTNKPCIFHTRKSTVGAHTEENCHPFVYTELKEGSPEWFFTIAHNGIIRNTTELENTYIKSKISNSKELLKIDSNYIALAIGLKIANGESEKEVLEKYEGNAALLYYTADNTFKAWKGGSNNVEERPMYYIETPEGWYFCSIESSLKIIFSNRYDVIELKNNELLTFENGKLKGSEIFERVVTKQIVVVNHSTYYSTYNKDFYTSTRITPTVSLLSGLYLEQTSRNLIDGSFSTYTAWRPQDREKYYSAFKSDVVDESKKIYFDKGVLIKNKAVYKKLAHLYNKRELDTQEFTKFFDKYYKVIDECLVDMIPILGKTKNTLRTDNFLKFMIYRDDKNLPNFIAHDHKNKEEIEIFTKFGYRNLFVQVKNGILDLNGVKQHHGYEYV